MTRRHRYSINARTMTMGVIGVLLKLTKTTLGNPVTGIGANYISRISGILMYYDLINELDRHSAVVVSQVVYTILQR